MKKAIVFGAFGFVGYGLCCQLLEKEVDVYGVDSIPRESSLEEEKLLQIGRNANFKMIDAEDFPNGIENEVVRTIDVVFFSMGDPIRSTKYHETSDMLKKIVRYCKNSRSRLVLLTQIDTAREKNEHLEELLELEENESDECSSLDYVVIQIPTIYGPWQPEEYIYQQAIIAKINDKEVDEFIIKEDTSDLLFIDDAINGILSIERTGKSKKEYKLTSGLDNQWYEGAQKISTTIKKDRNNIEQTEKSNSPSYIIQTPKISLEDGIKRQIEHAKWLKSRFDL